MAKKRRIPWPPLEEEDGETEHLDYLVSCGWYWSWPGWKWVAKSLNEDFGNDRSPEACRMKYRHLMKEMSK